jgi:C-methyltransferase C-terminal domain/Putative zinc binding domain/Methyltransferase domain
MPSVNCRFCHHILEHTFCDLGSSPLSNAFLTPKQLTQEECFYPLHVRVCSKCFLVQLPTLHTPSEIFSEYAYFSSFSSSWLKHCKTYAQEISKRFFLSPTSQVIEIASNDGYLLQFFKELGIPVLGIEPARNVAQTAIAKGIPTISQFFGQQFALGLDKQADLLIGNNVLAHVPDLNDFVAGMKCLLKERGVITMEFPHVLKLIEENQFDTIYHEHFSYFSLLTVKQVFSHHGLTLFDVEKLDTHGGSLRIYAKHAQDYSKPISKNLQMLLEEEESQGLNQIETYLTFRKNASRVKEDLLAFFQQLKKENKKIAAYGAPAKGNTLLNYCGLNSKHLPYTVDRNEYKQGKYLPGTHIPIYSPDKILETKPDYLLILPWNLKQEIMEENQCIRSWGGHFVIPIPRLEIQ